MAHTEARRAVIVLCANRRLGQDTATGFRTPARLTPATPQRPPPTLGVRRCQLERELAARRRLRSARLFAGDFGGTGGGAWFDAVTTKSLARSKPVYPRRLEQARAWDVPAGPRAGVRLARVVDGNLVIVSHTHLKE